VSGSTSANKKGNAFPSASGSSISGIDIVSV
jgi:hypothetical protein